MSKTRRRSHKYRIWQAEVFKRDNYSCQGYKFGYGCRSRERLTAHHVKPWSKFPKDRFKVNNGITLCDTCHVRLEKERREGAKSRGKKETSKP